MIIGGGGTGGCCRHDLTLRGYKVTLLERGEVTSGTTGRHHGLLHSGARYAVKDKESAVECIEENMILRRIAPIVLELNDGLFIALTEEEVAWLLRVYRGLSRVWHPARRLTQQEVLGPRAERKPRRHHGRPGSGRHDGRHAHAAAALLRHGQTRRRDHQDLY